MTVGQILQHLPDNSLVTWCEGCFKRDDDTEDIIGFAEDEEACFENVILKKFLWEDKYNSYRIKNLEFKNRGNEFIEISIVPIFDTLRIKITRQFEC